MNCLFQEFPQMEIFLLLVVSLFNYGWFIAHNYSKCKCIIYCLQHHLLVFTIGFLNDWKENTNGYILGLAYSHFKGKIWANLFCFCFLNCNLYHPGQNINMKEIFLEVRLRWPWWWKVVSKLCAPSVCSSNSNWFSAFPIRKKCHFSIKPYGNLNHGDLNC